MYRPGTILELKEPVAEDHDLAPYNRVKVVGQSPLNHGQSAGEWVGAQATGVVITPEAGFGQTLDEPLGKLNALYSVEFEPELPNLDRTVQVRQIEPGPSPEDQFRAIEEANGTKVVKSERRKRTTLTPEEALSEQS